MADTNHDRHSCFSYISKYKVLIFLGFLLMYSIIHPADVSAANPTASSSDYDRTSVTIQSKEKAAKKKKGWVKSDGNKYYYKKGKKVKGWNTINGKEYFFNNSGILQTNCITGNTAGGYDYVDIKGIRIKEPTIRHAVSLVRSVTNSSMTPKQKLDACYSHFVWNCSYQSNTYTFSIANFATLGSRLYTVGAGDCYQSALAMTYCARVLGFMARFAEGMVDAYSSVPNSVHGWCEVKVNGRYLVYDITMKRYHPEAPLGGVVTRSNYPYAIACKHTYYLHANNGTTFWKIPK